MNRINLNSLTQGFLVTTLIVIASCTIKEDHSQANDHQTSNLQTQLDGKRIFIDDLLGRVESHVLRGDIIGLHGLAGTQVSEEISAKDLSNYFQMVVRHYGGIVELEEYGSVMTATQKTVDYKTFFSKGDSIELRVIVTLSSDKPELSYVSFSAIRGKGDLLNQVPSISLTIDQMGDGDYRGIYQTSTQELQQQTSLPEWVYKYTQVFDNISPPKPQVSYVRPVLFGREQMGFVTQLTYGEEDETNLVYLVHIYEGDTLRLTEIRI